MGRSKPQNPARNAGQKRTDIPLHYERVHWLTTYVPAISRQDEPEAHAPSMVVRPRASTATEPRRSKRVRSKVCLDMPEIGTSVTVESAFRDALLGHLSASASGPAGASAVVERSRASNGREAGLGYQLGSSVRKAGKFTGERAIEGDVAYEQQNGAVAGDTSASRPLRAGPGTDGTETTRTTANLSPLSPSTMRSATAKAAGLQQQRKRGRKRSAPRVPKVLSFSAELRLQGDSCEPIRDAASARRNARTFLMSARALNLPQHFHSALLRHCDCGQSGGTSLNCYDAAVATNISAMSMSTNASNKQDCSMTSSTAASQVTNADVVATPQKQAKILIEGHTARKYRRALSMSVESSTAVSAAATSVATSTPTMDCDRPNMKEHAKVQTEESTACPTAALEFVLVAAHGKIHRQHDCCDVHGVPERLSIRMCLRSTDSAQHEIAHHVLVPEALLGPGADEEAVDAVCTLVSKGLLRVILDIATTIGANSTLAFELLPSAFVQLAPLSIGPPPSRTASARALQTLMHCCFGVIQCHRYDQVKASVDRGTSGTKLFYSSFNAVYEVNQRLQKQQLSLPQLPRLPQLVPKLRPYQERAVRWALSREGYTTRIGGNTIEYESESASQENPFWLKVCPAGCSSSASPIYFNPYTGAVREFKPPALMPVKGGILADEMGLGKTVEVIALILAHKSAMTIASTIPSCTVRPQNATAKLESQQYLTETNGIDDGSWRYSCVCGEPELAGFGVEDDWVQCDVCGRWQHRQCAGFVSEAEANGAYFQCVWCDADAAQRKLVCSGATLIVCPNSIIKQWVDEIERHTHGSLRVRIYQSIRRTIADARKVARRRGNHRVREPSANYGSHGGNNTKDSDSRTNASTEIDRSGLAASARIMSTLYTSTLADADIVLCTYDTLREDFHHGGDDINHENRVRRCGSRNHAVVRCPLLNINFFRVVLDEAQMVESGVANAARLARKITSSQAWAVTGTPLGKDKLDDLYGLLYFLHPDDHPLADGGYWRWALKTDWADYARQRIAPAQDSAEVDEEEDKCMSVSASWSGSVAKRKGKAKATTIQLPLLLRVLAPMMWRSTKAQVEDELGLPRQTVSVVRLDLSPVERLCYTSHEKALKRLLINVAARARGEKIAQSDRTGNFESLVLRLRQACIHPRLGQKGDVNTDINATAAISRAYRGGRGGRSITRNVASDLSPQGSTQVASIEQIANEKAVEAKIKCEEHLRQLAFYINMLAGLEILKAEIAQEQKDERAYRAALLTADRYYDSLLLEETEAPEGVRLDKSTKIHVFHNRQEVLEMIAASDEKVGSTCSAADIHCSQMHLAGVRKKKAQEMHQEAQMLRDELAKAAMTNQMAALEQLATAVRERKEVMGRMHAQCALRRNGTAGSTNADTTAWWHAWLIDGPQNQKHCHFGDTSVLSEQQQNAASMLSKLAAWHDAGGARTMLVPNHVVELFHRADCTAATLLCDWVSTCLDAVNDASTRAVTALEKAPLRPSPEVLSVCADCRVCRADWDKSGAVCAHCRHQALLWSEAPVRDAISCDEQNALPMAYEDTLFQQRRTARTGQRMKQRLSTGYSHNADDAGGNAGFQGQAWTHDHPVFEVLSVMRGWIRQRARTEPVLHDEKASEWWNSLLEEANDVHVWQEKSKLELKACKSVWQAHSDLLNNLDELLAFGSRLRLSPAGLLVDPDGPLVPRNQLDLRLRQAAADRRIAEMEFRRAVSHLKFVLTLAIKGECSTCHDDPYFECDSEGWSPPGLLKCAHWFCGACIRRQLGNSRRLRCALCRAVTASDELQYVSASAVGPARREGVCPDIQHGVGHAVRAAGKDSAKQIKGSWGTKIGRLVHDVLKLQGTDEKALIFSTWDEALALVAQALKENGVGFEWLKDRASYSDALFAFKNQPAAQSTVLLLPLKKAGNGLTLTEATHVMLLEPGLSSAVEAQAIGRIHRIGQVQPTTVHRYVVQGTVEERIYDMMHGDDGGANSSVSAAAEISLSLQNAAQLLAEIE